MKKVKLAFFMALALVLMVGVLGGGCAPKAPEVFEINFNTWTPNDLHPLVKAVEQPFKEGVESKSGGRIKVNVFWGNALAKERTAWDAVAAGVADITNAQTGEFHSRFPLARLMELPLIYSSGEQGTRASQDLFAKYPEFMEELGEWKLLWSSLNDVNQLHVVMAEPVKTLEDIKGKVVGSFGKEKTIDALGGKAEMILGGAEIYPGLEKKVWDMAVMNFGPFRAFHLEEVVESITLVGLGASQIQYAMNKEKYESLPKDLQQVIDEVIEPLAVAQARAFDKNQEDIFAWLRAEYPEVIIYELPPDELARWAAKMKPLQDEWVSDMEALGYSNARNMLNDFISFSKKY